VEDFPRAPKRSSTSDCLLVIPSMSVALICIIYDRFCSNRNTYLHNLLPAAFFIYSCLLGSYNYSLWYKIFITLEFITNHIMHQITIMRPTTLYNNTSHLRRNIYVGVRDFPAINALFSYFAQVI